MDNQIINSIVGTLFLIVGYFINKLIVKIDNMEKTIVAQEIKISVLDNNVSNLSQKMDELKDELKDGLKNVSQDIKILTKEISQKK